MMSRRGVVRAALALCALAALAIVIAAVQRLSEAEATAAAQRAEVERIRRALLQSAEAAERASIATTSPEVRQAQKDAAMREFQAAEAEMLTQQSLAKRAREARLTGLPAPENQGRGASTPRP